MLSKCGVPFCLFWVFFTCFLSSCRSSSLLASFIFWLSQHMVTFFLGSSQPAPLPLNTLTIKKTEWNSYAGFYVKRSMQTVNLANCKSYETLPSVILVYCLHSAPTGWPQFSLALLGPSMLLLSNLELASPAPGVWRGLGRPTYRCVVCPCSGCNCCSTGCFWYLGL